MRKVIVYYRDAMDNYREEYHTGPYTGDVSKSVMHNLKMMGCSDIRAVPYREKAA